jgi:hypothetical protein
MFPTRADVHLSFQGIFLAMLTRRLDAALATLWESGLRVPELRDAYRPGSPERAALDEFLDAAKRARAVVFAKGGASRRI